MFFNRTNQILQKLNKNGLTHFLITYPLHLRYLTNFKGANGVCVISRQSSHLIIDSIYKEQAYDEVIDSVIHIKNNFYYIDFLLFHEIPVDFEKSVCIFCILQTWNSSIFF